MKGKILNFFLILIIGGLGGVLANRLLLPYLATISPFSKIGFIHQAGNGTTIINPTQKIIITENKGLEEAIDRIKPTLVVIQSYQKKRLLKEGTGFIVTSDGLIITALDLISPYATQYLVLKGNDFWSAQVIKKDLKTNLALIRIDEENLPVVSLVEKEDLQLGERVVLLGAEAEKKQLNYFVNLGIVRSIKDSKLEVNLIEEDALANGGPLINIKGEVVGLNLINTQGLSKTIPANKIKEFINL